MFNGVTDHVNQCMNYTIFRCLSYIGDEGVCRLCKTPFPRSFVGLSYRDGRGNVKTHKFHTACAVKVAPLLIHYSLKQEKQKCDKEQLEELKATKSRVDEQAMQRWSYEKPWWDSGALYQVMINKETGLHCGLSKRKIEIGSLIILKPIVNFGKKEKAAFLFENAVQTTGFDWDHLKERLKVSLQDHPGKKEALLQQMRQIQSMHCFKELEDVIHALKDVQEVPFEVFGQDVQRTAKDLLRWDIFYHRPLPQKDQEILQNKLPNYRCAWRSAVYLIVTPGEGNYQSV